MSRNRKLLILVVASMALDLTLGLWFWSVDASGARHLIPWLVIVVAWLYAEAAQGPPDERRERILGWHRGVFAAVALFLALRMGLRLGFELELLPADWIPAARRGAGALGGALLAVWGNFLPKLLSPWPHGQQPFDWQRVHRFAGWVATLSGIAVAFVWLALSLDAAKPASGAILLTFCVLVIGRKLFSLAKPPRHQPPLAS